MERDNCINLGCPIAKLDELNYASSHPEVTGGFIFSNTWAFAPTDSITPDLLGGSKAVFSMAGHVNGWIVEENIELGLDSRNADFKPSSYAQGTFLGFGGEKRDFELKAGYGGTNYVPLYPK